MSNISISDGRLSFRWTNEFGTLFELHVLAGGEAGLFAQVGDAPEFNVDKWEHITPKVFDYTSCEDGIVIADSVDFALVLNTVHVSITSGFMSTYKSVHGPTGEGA